MDKKMLGVYVFFLAALLVVFPLYTGESLTSVFNSVVYAMPKKCEPSLLPKQKFDSNKATAVIVMDDGWQSEYTVAYPILKKYGFPGNIAVIPSKVDQKNYMSYQQIQTLYKEGWDLLNHTYTHPNLATLSKSQQTNEILSTTKWLDNNCFSRGSKIVVYPNGAFNDTTLSILKENNYLSARSEIEDVPPQKIYSKYKVPVQIESYLLDFKFTKQYIDDAIASKGTAVFVLHRFSTGSSMNDPMFYSEQNLEKLVKYLYENKSKIEVLSYSEWLQKTK